MASMSARAARRRSAPPSAAQGGTGTLKVYDQDGNLVGERPLGSVQPGKGSWELGSAAEGLEPGWYRYEIEVVDADGEKVPVQTFISGTIDGIQFTANGPVLKVGPYTIAFGKIVEILSNS
jgi:flagellar hook assembly protein FlgD